MSGRNTAVFTTQKRWAIELGSGGKKDRNCDNLASPPGYNPSVQVTSDNQRSSESDKLVMKKSWEIALGPIKGAPMNMFLLYMSGSSLSIFPIMMIAMMMMRTVKALFAMNASFTHMEGVQTYLQKFVYILGNIFQLMVVLYKCSSLGLLPTHASDWLAFQEPQQQLEFAHGALGLW